MQIEPTSHGPLVLEMAGTFDVPAARQLARALASADRGREVLIDLTRVREFHDFGLLVLAQALQGRSDPATVRGLTRHQLRLLGYLGLDRLTPAPPAS